MVTVPTEKGERENDLVICFSADGSNRSTELVVLDLDTDNRWQIDFAVFFGGLTMREILFRGKRTDNGEWIEGWYQPPIEGTHHDGRKESLGASLTIIGQDGFLEDVYIIPETVGQFTGLTDKNGKKIFDGDIVKDEYNGSVARIAYLPQTCGWVLVFKNTDRRLGHRSRGAGYTEDLYLEVIGNIHDNPELLEVTDNA